MRIRENGSGGVGERLWPRNTCPRTWLAKQRKAVTREIRASRRVRTCCEAGRARLLRFAERVPPCELFGAQMRLDRILPNIPPIVLPLPLIAHDVVVALLLPEGATAAHLPVDLM